MRIAIIGSGLSGSLVARKLLEKKHKVYIFSKNENIKYNDRYYNGSPKFRITDIVSKIILFKKNYGILENNFLLSSVLCFNGMSEYWGGGLEKPDRSKVREIKKRYGINISSSIEETLKLLNINDKKKVSPKFNTPECELKNLDIAQIKGKETGNGWYKKNNTYKIIKSEFLLKNYKNNFEKYNCFVKKIIKKGSKFQILSDKKEFNNIKFDKIIVSAGTVGTSIIINRYLNNFYKNIKLYHTPMRRLVYFSPIINSKFKEYLKNKRIATPKFQINLKVKNFNFKGSIMRMQDLSNEALGFDKNNFIVKILKKFFIVGNFFEQDKLSSTSIKFKNDTILISSDYKETRVIKKAKNKINFFFFKNFFFSIPILNFSKIKNGLDAHYTSTMVNLKYKNKNLIQQDLSLVMEKNIHVMDCSILPRGYHYPTFTTLSIINGIVKRYF
jgi:hypothetical protein